MTNVGCRRLSPAEICSLEQGHLSLEVVVPILPTPEIAELFHEVQFLRVVPIAEESSCNAPVPGSVAVHAGLAGRRADLPNKSQ